MQHRESLRPFYFIIVVWGDRFINYLVRYCLPSLLAPENIPALSNNTINKFLFCTTNADWARLQNETSFKLLAQYITPVFIEIPLPPPGTPSCVHMGVGHKLATELCFKDKAYGIALTPDLILSNGTMKNVEQHARNGVEIVFCAALRFTEEGVFAGLRDLGVPHAQANYTNDSSPLSTTGRELVKIAMHSMHSQTKTYDFNASYFAANSPAAFWRVPSDGGILLHSMSWCPMLLDYSVVRSHDTRALENWTMDGDYVNANFQSNAKIHVCQDSDEMMLMSWAPEDYDPVPLKIPFIKALLFPLKSLINKAYVHISLVNPLYDALKVKLFPKPVYWHIHDITPAWEKLENSVRHIVAPKNHRLANFANYIYEKTNRPLAYVHIICLALTGDQISRNRIKRKLFRLLPINQSISF